MNDVQLPTDPEIKADYWADAQPGHTWQCECGVNRVEGALIAKHVMAFGHAAPKQVRLPEPPTSTIGTLTETARLRDALKASLQALDLAIEVATQAGASDQQISLLHNLHTAIRMSV